MRDRHPEFCIPICILPTTISNNVPGTDVSLGSDTGLNVVVEVRGPVAPSGGPGQGVSLPLSREQRRSPPGAAEGASRSEGSFWVAQWELVA